MKTNTVMYFRALTKVVSGSAVKMQLFWFSPAEVIIHIHVYMYIYIYIYISGIGKADCLGLGFRAKSFKN